MMLVASCSFIVGCLLTTFIGVTFKLHLYNKYLHLYLNHPRPSMETYDATLSSSSILFGVPCLPQPQPQSRHQQQQQQQQQIDQQQRRESVVATTNNVEWNRTTASSNDRDKSTSSSTSLLLHDVKILVVIVAYDFSQLPHFEEVLNGYHDVCVAGAIVDIIVHATVPYPVTLIDLLNTRISCYDRYTVTITLKPKSLRLFLVDEHRKVFYDRIQDYDLFIYSEDDIRITPTTVATYLYETQWIQNSLRPDHKHQHQEQHQPSDFNVGIVRYEYNYPTNVIIDDNTRHATQNVTRVYWEHSGYERPVVGNAVRLVEQEPEFTKRYITMQNHHQGMYLATRELLLAWKDRGPTCDFAKARPRPGKDGQPTEGTQRVWMSSHMLYGGRHCGA
jgi:hypothetical protein